MKLIEEKMTHYFSDSSKLMNTSSRETVHHHDKISASVQNGKHENSGAGIWLCVEMGLLQIAMTVLAR